MPTAVESGGEVVTVSRAWPGRDGGVVVEGTDRHGRLRAGGVHPSGDVALLPHGSDRKLPALSALMDAGGELVVHRAARRAVVREARGYTKVVRPGRAPAVAEASRVGRLLAEGAGLAAPEVLRADEDTVTSSVLPGRPVHELSDDPAWDRVWETWAQAWTRLQEGEGELGTGLPLHTDRDEAQVVRGWAVRASAAGVLPGGWTERAELVARRLEEQDEPDRLVPTHRDLHDKQLLWDGDALGVLDLDTACLAAPELDPVNLAVHADLRRAQGLWSARAAGLVVRRVSEVAGRAGGPGQAGRPSLVGGPGHAGGPGLTTGRVRVAELATVVRLACVYAFRPAWRDVVLAWAEDRFADAGPAGAR